jgi:TP901 family phage tail tape measure protein
MAAGDIALKLILAGNATSAIAAMSGLTKQSLNLKNVVAMAGLAAGAAMVDFGAQSVHAAGDFGAGMTTLQTGAGELASNMNLVSNGVLDMSTQTGESTKQLTDGMFMIESAGYRGADGLNVLKDAAEGAKVGNADLGVVANAETTVMKDYGISANNAATAMNFLTAIVQNGKTTLQDLASSMSQVLPTAAAVKVHLVDVGGAMATMTSEGVPAANAATYLRQMLISLAAPSSAGSKALKDIGLSSQQVSDEMKKSLPGALQLIMLHLGETYKVGSPQYVTALKNIAGGSKQMQGMLDLTGSHLKEFQANVKNVSGTMNQGKGSVVGWSLVQQDFNFKMAQAGQAVNVLMIRLGTALLPIVSSVVTSFSNFVSWLSQGSTGARALEVALGVVVGALTAFAIGMGVLKAISIAQTLASWVSGFIAMIPAMWGAVTASWAFTASLLANPITWIVLAIIALIAGLVLLITHWSQVVSFLRGVWGAVVSWLAGIWTNIKNTAISVFTSIVNFFTETWTRVKNTATNIWGGIVGFLSGIWSRVTSVFSSVWRGIVSVLTVIWDIIKMTAFVIFAIIVAIILKPFVPLIDWFRAHWAQIQAALSTAWRTIQNIASTIWTAIGNFFSTIGTFIHNLITTVWSATSSFLLGIWSNISKVASSIWSGITTFFRIELIGWKNIISTVWVWISGFLSKIWSGIKSAASSIWGGISSSIMNVVHSLQDKLSNIWGNIKSAFSNAMNSLAGIAHGAWSAVSGAIKSAINTVIGLINGMIDGVNSVTSKVGIPSIPHIPYLASGGSNLSSGMYWVGESGPELLWIPQGSTVMSHQQSTALVSRPGSYALAGRGGGSSTIVVQPAPVYLDKRQVGQILFNYQASEIRKQGGIRHR